MTGLSDHGLDAARQAIHNGELDDAVQHRANELQEPRALRLAGMVLDYAGAVHGDEYDEKWGDAYPDLVAAEIIDDYGDLDLDSFQSDSLREDVVQHFLETGRIDPPDPGVCGACGGSGGGNEAHLKCPSCRGTGRGSA